VLNSNFELGLQRWVLDRGDLILLFNHVHAYSMYGFHACAMLLLALAPLPVASLHSLPMIIALPDMRSIHSHSPRFVQPYGGDLWGSLGSRC
jgi:hypothetical protein